VYKRQTLRSTITIVAIAHRISTVVASDKVVFMENGRVAAVGAYEELRELFKNDSIKTRILGLQSD
jgi:ABC-type multidrug transport system fused ATPase/permease subunit